MSFFLSISISQELLFTKSITASEGKSYLFVVSVTKPHSYSWFDRAFIDDWSEGKRMLALVFRANESTQDGTSFLVCWTLSIC